MLMRWLISQKIKTEKEGAKVNRLTDDKTAQALKEIIDKLEAGGFEVDMSNRRYVRLAEYERFDEEVERLGFRFTLDALKTIKELANEALDSYDYKGHTIREWVEIIQGKEGENDEGNEY